MEKIRGSGIDPNAFYERLVALGIAKASKIYAAVPTLADVIDPESDQFARARAMFPTCEAYQAELASKVSSVFEQFIVEKRVLEDVPLPFIERLSRLSDALRGVAQTNNAAFTAYCTLARTHALPESFDANIADIEPMFRTTLEIVRREIREQGGPQDVWLWVSTATTIYAGYLGLAHLSTFGIASHLLPSGKRQLCNSMSTHLFYCTSELVTTGTVCCPEPYDLINPERYVVPPAVSLPLDDATQRRFALFRSAIELIKNEGTNALSLSAVASRIGLQASDFLPFVEMQRPLKAQVEEFLNAHLSSIFMEQAAQLPPELPPYLMGTMPGVSYASIAMIDPLTFQVLSSIASGSIVPIAFDTELGDLEMGDALKLLFNIVEKNIRLGGGPTDSWTLFATTVSLWGVVHGLSMLVSCGPLSAISKKDRFDLIRAVVDISSSGMVRRLELDLPGASNQYHRIER